MLYDVWESFVDFLKLTVKPALRNLFSSKENFIGMFLAVFLLQTLLCVICISGVNNIVSQNRMLTEFGSYIQQDADAADTVAVLSNSVRILAGALAIWWICALSVYWKMTVSAADRSRYIWGMYITYGSARKKIRRMLLCELYLTMLCGDGVSVNVISPRRSGKLSDGFTPLRGALSVFFRSRKYYAALALAAAVPAVLWICLQTASVSEAVAISESIDEYALTYQNGISLENMQLSTEDIKAHAGVANSSSDAYASADALGIHLLLSPDSTTYPEQCAKLGDLYADGSAMIAVADDPVYLCGGFEFTDPAPQPGELAILLPTDYTGYNFNDVFCSGASPYLMLTLPSSDGGTISPVTDIVAALSAQLESERKYARLRISNCNRSYPSDVLGTDFSA